MRKAEKRILAFILAFAMVINPFTGIGALTTVKADPEDPNPESIFVYDFIGYEEGPQTEDGWSPGTYTYMCNENSAANTFDNPKIFYVFDKNLISLAIKDGEGHVTRVGHNVVSENRIVIEDISDPDIPVVVEGKDVLTIAYGIENGNVVFEEGVFLFIGQKCGKYRLSYEGSPYLYIDVVMPEVGIYKDDKNMGEDYFEQEKNLIPGNSPKYLIDETTDYYIHLNRDYENAYIVGIEISDTQNNEETEANDYEMVWSVLKEGDENKKFESEYYYAEPLDEKTVKVTVKGKRECPVLEVKYTWAYESDQTNTHICYGRFWFTYHDSRFAIADAHTVMEESGYARPCFEGAAGKYNNNRWTEEFSTEWLSFGILYYNNNVVEPVYVERLSDIKWYVLGEDDNWREFDGVAINPDEGEQEAVNIYTRDDDDDNTVLEDGVYRLTFRKEGTYKLESPNASWKSAVIEVNKAQVAVYTTSEPVNESVFCTRGEWQQYEENKTYYLNASDVANMWRVTKYNATLTVSCSDNVKISGKEAGETFEWNPAQEKSLAFTVDGYSDAHIKVHFSGDPNPDEEGNIDQGEDYEFNFYRKPTGMCVSNATDEKGNIFFKNQDSRFAKTLTGALGHECWIAVGVPDAEDSTIINPLPVEELMGLKLYKNGKPTGIKLRYTNYWENQLEPTPGIVWFDAQEGGEFELRKADGSDYSVIDITYPWGAFTKAKQGAFDVSDKDVRDQLVEDVTKISLTGGEQNKVYLSVRSDSKVAEGDVTDIVEIEGITFDNKDNQEMVKENLSCVIAADKKSAVITVKDKYYLQTVDVNVTYSVVPATCVNGKLVSNESDRFNAGDCLVIEFDQDQLTDGDGGKTFSAVFMPKSWYDSRTPWEGQMDYLPYWVHDDSMQGAIDKLVDAANQEYADVYSASRKKWIKSKVVNTGYIYIVTNVPRGGKDLGKSYISCPGDLKGIMINAGNYENASFSDSKETTGLDFMDAPIMDPADFATKLNNYKADIQGKDNMVATLNSIADAADGVVFEAGVVYRAVKKTHSYVGAVTGRQHVDDYYYFDKTPLFSLDEGIYDRLKVAGIPQLTYLEGVNITASQTCGYVFRGDMGDLMIGFPEGLDPANMAEIAFANFEYDHYDEASGKYTENSYLNRERHISFAQGADSYPVAHDDVPDGGKWIRSDGKIFDNYEREYYYYFEYKLHTYKIKMQTKVEGNVGNVEVNKGDLDPNAFKNLSQADKEKIENGAALTVNVRTDAVDPANLPSVAENAAVAELKQSVAEIDDTMKDYDKDKINGDISYFDIGVSTSVAVSDNSAGAGEEKPDIVTTKEVSETSKPMEIIIPITGKSYIDLAKVRFVRSHKTADGSYTNDFFKMYTDEAKFNDNRRDGVAYIEKVSDIQFNIHLLSSRYSTFAMFEYTGEPEVVDLSRAKWDYSGAVKYDGKAHEVKLTGLPKGVFAYYKGNEKTEIGQYIATVEFSVTDDTLYKLPTEIPAKLQSLEWEINEKGAYNKDTNNNSSSGGFSGGGGGGGAVQPVVSGNAVSGNAVSGNTVSGNTVSGNTVSGNTVSDNAVKVGDSVKVDGVKAVFKITGLAKDGKTGTVTYVKAEEKNAKKIVVPAKVTIDGKVYVVNEIAPKAFKGCKKLKKVVIPKTVTKIGAKAFKGDKGLKTVKIKSKKIKSFGNNSFKGVKATVKVPKSKKAAYTKALKKAGFKGKVK